MVQLQTRIEPGRLICIDGDGYTALALAILARAIVDAYSRNGYSADAVQFLQSKWAALMGDALQVDVDLVWRDLAQNRTF